jgi:hypothetical protein
MVLDCSPYFVAMIIYVVRVLFQMSEPCKTFWQETTNSTASGDITVLLSISLGFFMLEVLETIRSRMQDSTSQPTGRDVEANLDQEVVDGLFASLRKRCRDFFKKITKQRTE